MFFRRSSGWVVAGLCLAAGGALCCAPPVVQERLRSIFRDGLRPGQVLGMAASERIQYSLVSEEDAARDALEESLRRELGYWKGVARRNAMLAARGEATAPTEQPPAEPLFSAQLIRARVLSQRESAEAGRILSTIDLGGSSALAAEHWVLDDAAMTIDQGTQESVGPDDPVITGRSVFGKIATAGRWTSSVQHVSDAGFRTHARLLRTSPERVVQGAEGMLVGAGNGMCRLELVATTEPVEVGDEVWTAGAIPGLEEALCLGRVTRAELVPTNAHWTIDVTPELPAANVRVVQVVRVGLNPHRQPESEDDLDVDPPALTSAAREGETR